MTLSSVLKSNPKVVAYGGVLLDEHGRILLRRPRGHFDGYVWTFPKGRPEAGETPEQAALREVREETGHEVRITSKLAGQFEGGTTKNEYYLMNSVRDHGDFDRFETCEVRWFEIRVATRYLGETTNVVGRNRDLAVLAKVRQLLGI